MGRGRGEGEGQRGRVGEVDGMWKRGEEKGGRGEGTEGEERGRVRETEGKRGITTRELVKYCLLGAQKYLCAHKQNKLPPL